MNDKPSPNIGGFELALQAGPGLSDIAASLLLALFPTRQLVRAGGAGRLERLLVKPPLTPNESRKLLDHLFTLVERPEWRDKHAVAREVQDVGGRRLELLTPLPPGQYRGGEALVGPFRDEAAANEWATNVAEPSLASDTVPMAGAYLVDLFALGDLLSDGHDQHDDHDGRQN